MSDRRFAIRGVAPSIHIKNVYWESLLHFNPTAADETAKDDCKKIVD